MTAKEAVLSLMSKDPSNPTIRALKKNGMLKEILYADQGDREYRGGGDQNGERGGNFDRRDRDEMMGREGGRSVRSIAKDKETRGRGGMEGSARPPGEHQKVLDFDTDGWGTKRPAAAKEEVLQSHLSSISHLPAPHSCTLSMTDLYHIISSNLSPSFHTNPTPNSHPTRTIRRWITMVST